MNLLFVAMALLVVPCHLVSVPAVQQPYTTTLSAPLTTVVRAQQPWQEQATGAAQIVATVIVPTDAPENLGVGAFVADDDGTWWQILKRTPLVAGRHHLAFELSKATTYGEPHHGRWSARQAQLIHEYGLFFYSEQYSRSEITIAKLDLLHAPPLKQSSNNNICEHFSIDGVEVDHIGWHAKAGERVTWRLRPHQMPNDLFAPHAYAISVSQEDRTERVPGFYCQPMQLIDLGCDEAAEPASADRFEFRWRPRQPGRYRVVLHLRTSNNSNLTRSLPDLHVHGPATDPFVRIDPSDHRFFSTGDGQFVWPIGINGHSVFDERGSSLTGSRLTTNRGWHSYQAYLERWAAHGITSTEIWMAPWNLALEWRNDWPGFHGIEAYSQANAERLDRILDHAWKLGIRIKLVINNHGQFSSRTDKQWPLNPWYKNANDTSTGPLSSPFDWFRSERARQGQDRLRRYIIARWAEHPAVWGWKILSEEDMTDVSHRKTGDQNLMRAWHQHTAEQWSKLDPYGHPVTTHWAGQYNRPDRTIVAMPAIDYVCINAYHSRSGARHRPQWLLSELLWQGLHDRTGGLQLYNKPVVVTEFGGASQDVSLRQLNAEHESAPWASLMTGYAGSAMLWWFEWADQSDHYGVFQAISRFIADEDLRSQANSSSRSTVLNVLGTSHRVWCRAWVRPGRILGYALDYDWGWDGRDTDPINKATILIGQRVSAGTLHCEWWDCHTGAVTHAYSISHPGGQLKLPIPAFHQHIAFKLWREPSSPGESQGHSPND